METFEKATSLFWQFIPVDCHLGIISYCHLPIIRDRVFTLGQPLFPSFFCRPCYSYPRQKIFITAKFSEHLEGKSTSVSRSQFLRVGGIRLTFAIDEIRDSTDNNCIHQLIGMGCAEETNTFHLDCYSIIILLP